jgi:hypothetical protein
VGSHLIGVEDGPADADPGTLSDRSRDGDLGSRPLGLAHPPERRRRAVAEHRARHDEDRGHPDALPREAAMTDGIHPTMNRMQPPGLDAALYRTAREPELGELPARHDAMLARRERSGTGVRPARSTFTTTTGVNVERIRHAADLGDGPATAEPPVRHAALASSRRLR